jgi:hypothetical protein
VAVVAGTALAAALIGGLPGFFMTKLTNKANQTQLLTRLQHERAMAREERQQDRKGEAYVELLKFVHWMGSYYAEGRANITRYGEPRFPSTSERLSEEQRDNVLALVTAFGSNEVQSFVKELITTQSRDVESAGKNLDIAKEENSKLPPAQRESLAPMSLRVHFAFQSVTGAIESIRAQVKRELQDEGA